MTILCATDSTPVAALWARATGEELVLEKQLALDARASLVVLDGFDSTTDRMAQACHAPLLVVRDPRPLEQWLSRQQPLAVAVAYDPSPTGDAALAWAVALARIAPVAIVALHAYGIHAEREKRGLGGPLPIGSVDARIEGPLAAELRRRIGEHALVLRGCLGRPAEPLAEMAAAAGAGLLVVGNHHRRKLERAWKGSVSRGLLELAKCSVACISVTEAG
jgi:nucleotide-binding universal stress UspA family protein